MIEIGVNWSKRKTHDIHYWEGIVAGSKVVLVECSHCEIKNYVSKGYLAILALTEDDFHCYACHKGHLCLVMVEEEVISGVVRSLL